MIELLNNLKLNLYNIIYEFQSGHDNSAVIRVGSLSQEISKIMWNMNQNGMSNIIENDGRKLNNILLNVANSIKTENYILIDDLLEYEFIPMIDEWISKLDPLKGDV
ncbi:MULTISPECIES: hypothetical protein [Clostridium]|uniref:hypothetical protein n=1 Tax=Clostridium TaxID=1485 RepID=UPI0008255543|nr:MULTISPECIES: hypothetical protein [Clostridium]PJI09834.1 hypothetical protein CUB90_19030 [Clostridium sp. CT7]